MGKRKKSKTLTGKRIPFELEAKAKLIQRRYMSRGKSVSLQDVYRMMARGIA